jgi:hypothetical protein
LLNKKTQTEHGRRVKNNCELSTRETCRTVSTVVSKTSTAIKSKTAAMKAVVPRRSLQIAAMKAVSYLELSGLKQRRQSSN